MADSFSADVPFNQVLNKEVSNRNNDTRDKPRDVVREATPDPVKAGTPVASNQTAAAQTAQPAKSSDKDVAKKPGTTKTATVTAPLLPRHNCWHWLPISNRSRSAGSQGRRRSGRTGSATCRQDRRQDRPDRGQTGQRWHRSRRRR